MKIGVECTYGFGDCVFAAPAIRAISQHHNAKATVAVQQQCADAFANLEFIDRVLHIGSMWDGIRHFESHSYDRIYQLTPQVRFEACKSKDPEFSLIDSAKHACSEYGIEIGDQRPIFNPTTAELRRSTEYASLLHGRPCIAIESYAKSGQSWADQRAIDSIIEAHKSTHQILWLSNVPAPDVLHLHALKEFSRREIIMLLRCCEKFFSVGSGFFCASMALPTLWQPREIITLWIDHYYKYERRLAELKWHDKMVWLHDHIELDAYLKNYGQVF